eukprot:SAG11_NODE_1912_length_4078_cov_2.769289_2_plen_271_part_00
MPRTYSRFFVPSVLLDVSDRQNGFVKEALLRPWQLMESFVCGTVVAEELVWNYWFDAEPYNVIRSRLWSEELQAWCFLVFHTQESLEMSEARLAHYQVSWIVMFITTAYFLSFMHFITIRLSMQRSMGMVFHTATFQDQDLLAKAVIALKADTTWAARVEGMTIPKGVTGLGKLIQADLPAEADVLAAHMIKQVAPVKQADENFIAALGAPTAQLLLDAELAEESGFVLKAVNLYEQASGVLRVNHHCRQPCIALFNVAMLPYRSFAATA